MKKKGDQVEKFVNTAKEALRNIDIDLSVNNYAERVGNGLLVVQGLSEKKNQALDAFCQAGRNTSLDMQEYSEGLTKTGADLQKAEDALNKKIEELKVLPESQKTALIHGRGVFLAHFFQFLKTSNIKDSGLATTLSIHVVDSITQGWDQKLKEFFIGENEGSIYQIVSKVVGKDK